MPVDAAVGLGSNLGSREEVLRAAVSALADLGEVVAVSPLYETAPIGGPDQGNYLNAVAIVRSELRPRALLDALLAMEVTAGRVRRERWEARPLDLDLLLFGNERIAEPGLTVPHPRMTARRFVLEPLLAVRPDASLPDGSPLAAYLAGLEDQEVAMISDDWATLRGSQ